MKKQGLYGIFISASDSFFNEERDPYMGKNLKDKEYSLIVTFPDMTVGMFM